MRRPPSTHPRCVELMGQSLGVMNLLNVMAYFVRVGMQVDVVGGEAMESMVTAGIK